MSIFGSITGFISTISRTGSESQDSGSRSGSPSDSSSGHSNTAETTSDDGSRRTSAVLLEAPEVDLSHLSEEERTQIAAVIARAKSLQNFSDANEDPATVR